MKNNPNLYKYVFDYCTGKYEGELNVLYHVKWFSPCDIAEFSKLPLETVAAKLDLLVDKKKLDRRNFENEKQYAIKQLRGYRRFGYDFFTKTTE